MRGRWIQRWRVTGRVAKDRVMWRCPLVLRASGGVVVERDGLAGNAGRGAERLGVAMERELARREDHGADEEGRDLLYPTRHRGVPQLEMAAVVVAPVPVELDQHVETAVRTPLWRN